MICFKYKDNDILDHDNHLERKQIKIFYESKLLDNKMLKDATKKN